MSGVIAPTIWAVVVALTLWPRIAGRRLGFAVYVLTMTINDIPVVFLLIVGVGVWLGVGDRPSGPVGVAWIVLWGFVVGGLVWVQGRGRTGPPRPPECVLRRVVG